MTYREAVEYIHSVVWRGSRPGLSRICELLARLGNPEEGLKFIHIAGTNGKGSTSAMTESVLREAGYKTGLFVSPYIKSFNERIAFCGVPIDNESLAEITARVKPHAEQMADTPTEFELITAIGLCYFRQMNCDIVVLETGMGGRLDSTNVIKDPLATVITGIALDHTEYLGDTVEKIAAEKAGIIKRGAPVVWGGHDARARAVIETVAESVGAPLPPPRIPPLRCKKQTCLARLWIMGAIAHSICPCLVVINPKILQPSSRFSGCFANAASTWMRPRFAVVFRAWYGAAALKSFVIAP